MVYTVRYRCVPHVDVYIILSQYDTILLTETLMTLLKNAFAMHTGRSIPFCCIYCHQDIMHQTKRRYHIRLMSSFSPSVQTNMPELKLSPAILPSLSSSPPCAPEPNPPLLLLFILLPCSTVANLRPSSFKP